MGKTGKNWSFIDLTGKRFGRLTVLHRLRRTPKSPSSVRWICACDCGKDVDVLSANLRNGTTNSCGCLRREVAGGHLKTHGMSRSPTHRTWAMMIQRCTNPKVNNYAYYGGRGIKVDDRWLKFENFIADLGERPDGLTLDRIDPNGNYEPGNCRWADKKLQAKNRRAMLIMTLDKFRKFINTQTYLDEETQNIIYRNIWALYTK